jgi:hypothetical protein
MIKMLLFFKHNYFLKRKTAINVFFGSYMKGKYWTFNNETEPSDAETHRKPLPPLEFDECYSHHFLDMIM